MRNIFTPALEAHQFVASDVTISLEEEAILIDEANQDANAVATALDESERGLQIADSLEDLAVVAGDIQEASPTDIGLIQTAANLAVAGTETPSEALIAIPPAEGAEVVEGETPVVSIESYLGKKIAVEGFKETAKQIWETILKYLKQAWDYIEGFFYKTFGTIPNLRKSVKALQEKVDGAKDLVAGKEKLKITSGAGALSVNYKPVENGSELIKGLVSIEHAASFVFGAYVDSVIKRGDIVAKAIKEFTPAEPTDAATALCENIAKVAFASAPKSKKVNTTRYPGFETHVGEPMLGNVSIAAKFYARGKDESVLAALDRHRNTLVELIPSSENKQTVSKEFEIAPLSIAEMSDALKECLKVLDTAEAYHRGSKSKAILTTRKALEEASKAAEKAVATARDGDASANAAVPYYRAMLNFNAGYTRWVQSPAIPMLQHSQTAVRAALMLVSKSLSQYSAKVEAK